MPLKFQRSCGSESSGVWRLLSRVAPSIATAILMGIAPGCAGYRLGPTNGVVAGTKTIQVLPFENQTYEPRLIEAVASALRTSLQQDGTYKLASRRDSDIVVTGKIVRYERSAVSFDPRDIITPRDLDVSLVAHIVARDRISGKPVLDREVIGRATIRVGADLASAERQVVPVLAENLARNATSLLVDGTW